MDLPDAVRLAAGLLGVALSVTCCAGMVYARGWDQTMRFLVLLGYAVVTIGAQLDGIGREPTWRTFAAIPIGLLAIASTGVFVVRNARSNTGRGAARGRSDDQRRVLGPGPAARGADGDRDRPQQARGDSA